MSRLAPRVALVIGLTLGAVSWGTEASSSATDQAAVSAPTEGRYIFRYTLGAKASVRAALARAFARIHHELDDLNAIAATVGTGQLDALRNNPNIEYVEQDPIRKPLSLDTTPYGISMVQAPDVWATYPGVNGGDKKVCIIDSGLAVGHEDLAAVPTVGSDTGWNIDHCGHGSHVAGTIAAQLNDVGVVGVAPGVSLHIVKVFGDNCSWTYASTLADAASKCQAAGANIISMSLGGGAPSTTEQQKFDQLYGAGILSVAAAGNDGTTAFSYPASYNSVVSVAAIDSNDVVADFSQKNTQVELAAPGVAVLSSIGFIDATLTVDGATYEGFNVENAPRKAASGALVDGGLCDSTGSWSGKAVLCQRGSITFFTKVNNVRRGGGVAAIIFNNVAGGFEGTLGDGKTTTIAAMSVSQADGNTLLGKLGRNASVNTTQTYGVSRYATWDGTSMATPHVSGVAALVWSAFPDLTAANIRYVLRSTALDFGVPGRDDSYGYGLVQAKAAIDYIAGGGSLGDTTPPVISGVTAVMGSGKFTISWTTDEPATSEVVFSGGATGTFSDATLVTSHSMSFRGKKGATYTYSVSSMDEAGNKSTAGPFTYQN